MLRIKHTSDNHGRMPNLHGKFDVWVSSGDFFPDFPKAVNRREIATLQKKWLEEFAIDLAPWLTKKPFLFVQGNHDFCDAAETEKVLRSVGIDAHNAHDKIITIKDTTFYGFPWLLPINGCFNYEIMESEMVQKIDEMSDIFNDKVIDVLITHAPPYGILDTYKRQQGEIHGGNSFLNHALDYKIIPQMLPQAVCFGHIHDKAGIKLYNSMLMVNSAQTATIIEI